MSKPVFPDEVQPRTRKKRTLTKVTVLRAQAIGSVRTIADALAWLAAHDAHGELALMDVFHRDGPGFLVLTHIRSPAVRTASS